MFRCSWVRVKPSCEGSMVPNTARDKKWDSLASPMQECNVGSKFLKEGRPTHAVFWRAWILNEIFFYYHSSKPVTQLVTWLPSFKLLFIDGTCAGFLVLCRGKLLYLWVKLWRQSWNKRNIPSGLCTKVTQFFSSFPRNVSKHWMIFLAR